MTTDYDPIAELYKLSKQQPWRTHIEAHSLMGLIGDLTGKSVLDVACGEGFYTRMIRQRGAHRVTGVDLSAGMIELACRQEATLKQGIEYRVADARQLDSAEPFDLVVAAYLLNYAQTPDELQAMCNGIARGLKPSGRFVTVNSNPACPFPQAPSFRKYGFETSVAQTWVQGSPIKWTFHLEDRSFDIENYYLDVDLHEQALRTAGFREIRWHQPQVSSDGINAFGADFWQTFLNCSPVTLIECVK